MRQFHLPRKTTISIAMLLVFGLVREPLESRLTERFEASGLVYEVSTEKITRMVVQSSAFALLGSLRTLAAIYTTLHAFDAWSYRKWDTVERDYRLITTLLPDDIDSWKTGAWHLAYNASASAQYDDPTVPESVAEKNARDWMRKGVTFLEKGIEENPESAELHEEVARIFLDEYKLDEPCLAARHYKQALELGPTRSYIPRFYGYALAQCEGHEREAYDYLMRFYRAGGAQRKPTVINELKKLEEKLGIPPGERIPEPDPDEEILRRFPNAKLPYD